MNINVKVRPIKGGILPVLDAIYSRIPILGVTGFQSKTSEGLLFNRRIYILPHFFLSPGSFVIGGLMTSKAKSLSAKFAIEPKVLSLSVVKSFELAEPRITRVSLLEIRRLISIFASNENFETTGVARASGPPLGLIRPSPSTSNFIAS